MYTVSISKKVVNVLVASALCLTSAFVISGGRVYTGHSVGFTVADDMIGVELVGEPWLFICKGDWRHVLADIIPSLAVDC
jgi:hypothetical protein